MRKYTARVASAGVYQLGEGPVWDAQRERILWVDVVAGRVHTGVLRDGTIAESSSTRVDQTVGSVVVAETGALLVAGRHDLHLVDLAGNQHRVVGIVPPDKRSRLNDGGCDPAGRFVVGSLAQDGRTGDECLYRWSEQGTDVLDDDLTLSNGLAWSADGGTLYSIDTQPGTVWQREYDAVTGACGPRDRLMSVRDGLPDGLCLDLDGNLWIAIWGAGEVRCYRCDGTLLATVEVAAPHTSSVAFVGPDLDVLLITTARGELTDEQLLASPNSGRLFLTEVGTRGQPVPDWRPPRSLTLPEP
jgi:sugar lactone lactonase YvrE